MAFYVETLKSGFQIARWDKPLRSEADFKAMCAEVAEMRAAYIQEHAITRTTLADWEIAQLAEKYPRGNLSQEQYDGLLEELVDRGVLARYEINDLGYKGMICTPLEMRCWAYQCDEFGNPLTDAYGNSLDWTKRLAGHLPKELSSDVANVFLFAANYREEFNILDTIFARMDSVRSPWPVPAQ